MVINWKRSATKHRISRQRSGHVVRTTDWIFRVADHEDRVLFLGPDQTGVVLEVIAVETDDGGLLINHAMPIRNRYRGLMKGDPDDDH
jgi:hypothetical protein